MSLTRDLTNMLTLTFTLALLIALVATDEIQPTEQNLQRVAAPATGSRIDPRHRLP